MWLLFPAIFLALTLLLALIHEPALVAVICQGTVGLTFAVLVLSACNLTDQRTEADQSVLTEKLLCIKKRRIIKILAF